MTKSSNPCTVPNCRNKIYGYGLCQAHLLRLRTYGDTLDHIPIGSRDLPHLRPGRFRTGPFFCVCLVSRPDPKCCTRCGYPSVYRMTPAIRDRALAKMPQLRDQVIASQPEEGAA